MEIENTKLQDAKLIKPDVFGDERGFFFESYSEKKYKELGVHNDFVQDNHSKSQEGILRGLHLQVEYPQAKLVRVSRGAVLDVIVDLRPNSNSFRKWQSFELSASNKLQLLVPEGFAHGFFVLEEGSEFLYKCSEYYHPEDELTLQWNDEELSVDWPSATPTLSKKDSEGLTLKDIVKKTEASYSKLIK